MIKKTLFSNLFIFLVIISSSYGYFYFPTVSPPESGSVKSSIESRTEILVTEHYLAVPAPGYVFDSWSLYPKGEHDQSLYIHKYDPNLFYTQEVKVITANFVKANQVTSPNIGNTELNVESTGSEEFELSFLTSEGFSYSLQHSADLNQWHYLENDIIGTGKLYSKRYQTSTNLGFFKLNISDSKSSDLDEPALSGSLIIDSKDNSFKGHTAWIRLWEYHPLIADKAADLVSEKKIGQIVHNQGNSTSINFSLGDKSTIKNEMNYYITVGIYEGDNVNDLDKRTHFLDGFNRVSPQERFEGTLKRLK